jgi:ubiquinone/menaquinone biosynthesis C-methylase UbiE
MIEPMYTLHAGDYEKAILNNVYNAHLERPSMLSMLPDLKGKSVLDLGCGPGVYAEHFMNHGATVTASDISPDMIEIVQKKFGKQLLAYVADSSYGVPNEQDCSYDLVVCSLAIHYIEDLTCLFKDVRRVLKKDGSFHFSTHHPMVDFKSSPSGNYFKRELITEEWNTIGRPVPVQFYRRSLTELFKVISCSNMYVSSLNEGSPSVEMKKISIESYEHLSQKPNFLFIECKQSA